MIYKIMWGLFVTIHTLLLIFDDGYERSDACKWYSLVVVAGVALQIFLGG